MEEPKNEPVGVIEQYSTVRGCVIYFVGFLAFMCFHSCVCDFLRP